LTVGCTFAASALSEAASGTGRLQPIAFADLREAAGWSTDASGAGPKMAALLAAAAVTAPEPHYIDIESSGVILIYGRDAAAIEAGLLLKDQLDVTVLIRAPVAVAPPRAADFPIAKGKLAAAKGHLGAFDLTIDEFAQPMPSSRGALLFGPGRDGAQWRCDIVLDLSGERPLFAAAELRDGYLRADPGSRPAMLEAVLRARDLVGSFKKPRYVTFEPSRCAHSRSQIVGCRRCLDLCPTGAITPAGDHVAIDPNICAGCGQCAAACPTEAASYAVPPEDVLLTKLRAILLAYRKAGGTNPIVLVHDVAHGAPLLDALARFGDGLPAHVLPLAVNEVTQVGLESIAAAFAYGASAMRFLLRARPRHHPAGLHKTIALAALILAALGFDAGSLAAIEMDDPEVLGGMLREIPLLPSAPRPAGFLAAGGKRELLRLALSELCRAAPTPVETIALPAGAPFGSVEVDAEHCTLCLACVSACPTGALQDDPERPLLRFVEDICVQCGLCAATCPERVISLTPRIDFRAATEPARVLKEEQPFCCIQCRKPFGVKSTIERVVATLEGKHWMYPGASDRIELIKMCEDCRARRVLAEHFEPHAAADRSIRTTDDYLRESGAATVSHAASEEVAR
jgi:ferredoxin